MYFKSTCRRAQNPLLEKLGGVGRQAGRDAHVVDPDETTTSEGDVRVAAILNTCHQDPPPQPLQSKFTHSHNSQSQAPGRLFIHAFADTRP